VTGLFFRALALASCLLLAIIVARMGLADHLQDRDPVLAASWWPWHASAQSIAAKGLIDRAEFERAAPLARDRLRRNALDGPAYSDLALIASQRGDSAQAAALMRLAVKYGPRQRLAHFWLADHAVGAGDFWRALAHLDEVLRLSPRQLHTISPALRSIAQHPRGRTMVSRWLGEHAPPWRGRFLTGWASKAAGEIELDAMFDPLRRAPYPLSPVERDLWVARLVALGRVSKAHFLWIDGLPSDMASKIGNVFDGGFELPPSGGSFGWRFGRVAGAGIRQQHGGGVEGEQALLVEFRDRRVAFDHVSQLLALPAGAYRLSGRVRLDDLRNERGLVWALSCDRTQTALAQTERFSGRRQWEDFAVEFNVPAEGCSAQWLRLRLDARVAGEQMIGGRAWFDALKIVRRRGDVVGQVSGD